MKRPSHQFSNEPSTLPRVATPTNATTGVFACTISPTSRTSDCSGNSVAGLLGEGTGEMRLYVRDGTLSKQMLDLAALNLGSIIVGKLFGENKEVHLRCAVADFTVVDGLATTRVVKMSTEDAIVEATGTIDLSTDGRALMRFMGMTPRFDIDLSTGGARRKH